MELRNLKRWYLIDHSMSRHNKQNEPITKQQLAILLSIYFSSLKCPIVKTGTILSHLKHHKKAIRPDVLSRQLKGLEKAELIKRDITGRISRFNLTVYGVNELKSIEELNRACRQ